MAITIGSNITALQAQARLAKSSGELAKVFERLSSGLRINRASDDAAGLSIASALNADTRVLTQGIRNLNDGVSLLSIAAGGVRELSSITIRQSELAEQAANGVYSTRQRLALNAEARQLTAEYNRIVATTKFNDLKLLDRDPAESIVFQGGYGINGGIAVNIALESQLGGDGTFDPAVSYNFSGIQATFTRSGDINNDGKLDLVSTLYNDGDFVGVMLGNGDGTFKSQVSYSTGAAGSTYDIALADFNEDGKLDAVTTGDSSSPTLLLGNGDGTFQAGFVFGDFTTVFGRGVRAADINGDGHQDYVALDENTGLTWTAFGHGNGTFDPAISSNHGGVFGLTVSDINGDGIVDLITGDSKLNVSFGIGNGTFGPSTSYSSGNQFSNIRTADVNSDGNIDIVAAEDAGSVKILINNGIGGFTEVSSLATGGSSGFYGTFVDAVVFDTNGDGKLDVVASNFNNSTLALFLGNGDGTFRARSTSSSADQPLSLGAADLSGDGVIDLFSPGWSAHDVNVFISNSTSSPWIEEIDLSTQATARSSLDILKNRLNSLNLTIGKIGSFESRLNAAISNLSTSVENFSDAESRIRDADIAIEAANLARLSILQQAGAAVLAQAKQAPALALQLLKSI